MKRSFLQYVLLAFKGLAMGTADIIPGVSGGTIAFITGIYEELIQSIRSFKPSVIGKLASGRISEAWRDVNGTFLVVLLGGIMTAILSLAKLMKFLLNYYDILVWAFFFGLIVASALLVSKQVKQWNSVSYFSVLIGGAIAFYITVATPTETPTDLWFIFLSGALAICAMILPGISGAFILLLLGKYAYTLDALNNRDILVVLVFIAGCASGLLAFSHLLGWMFRRYHDATVALLTGFMIGSLNKVWPWKETISTRINSHGETVPVIQENILPQGYTGEPWLMEAVMLCLFGFFLVIGLELLGKRLQRN